MRTMIVALWCVDTQNMQNASLDARSTALEQAVGAAYKEATTELGKMGQSLSEKPYGLFVAPEYFMAQPVMIGASHGLGTQRHIEESEKEIRLARFKQLSNAHKGLIIVPGTVAWRKPLERTGGSVYHLKDPHFMALKTESRYDKSIRAVTQYAQRMDLQPTDALAGPLGGVTPAPTTQQKLNALQAPSGPIVDLRPPFMARNTAYVLYSGRVIFKYNKKGDYHEVLDGGSTVHIPGVLDGRFQLKPEGNKPERPIDFGIEICLDHVFDTAARDIPHLGKVDVHIISSAYVQADKASLAVKAGGYLAHACSKAAFTTVQQLKDGFFVFSESLKGDGPYRTETISGCELRFWKIELNLS
jgi:predicted amidohydrolase